MDSTITEMRDTKKNSWIMEKKEEKSDVEDGVVEINATGGKIRKKE